MESSYITVFYNNVLDYDTSVKVHRFFNLWCQRSNTCRLKGRIVSYVNHHITLFLEVHQALLKSPGSSYLYMLYVNVCKSFYIGSYSLQRQKFAVRLKYPIA